MGFWDFFKIRKNSKVLELPEGNIKDNQRDKKDNIDVKITSRKDGEYMQYNIVLGVDGQSFEVGEMYSENGQITPIREVAQEIKEALNPMVSTTNKYTLAKARKQAQDDFKLISIKNSFALNPEVSDFIKNYQSDNILDYKQTNKLPKTIDADKIDEEYSYCEGRKLQKRLDKLEKIKSPEDAYENRYDIISFMMDMEEDVPSSAIVAAQIDSLKNGKQLNEETVKAVAKFMEQEFDNEDGALYPVYLKLEEKRVWKAILKELTPYLKDETKQSKELIGILSPLSQYQLPDIPDIKGEFATNTLVKYIMKEMNQRVSINKYNDRFKKYDLQAAMEINNKDKYPDLEHRKEILEFFYARMGSLGQLSYPKQESNGDIEDKKVKYFREFVEETNFKSIDNKESKEFLFLVAQIEKDYIKNGCKSMLQIYNKKEAENQTKNKTSRQEEFHQNMKVENVSGIAKQSVNQQEKDAREVTNDKEITDE